MSAFDTVLITLAVLGSVGAFLWVQRDGRRRRAPGSLMIVGEVNAVCGLLIGLLGSAHLVAVVGRALSGRGFQADTTFTYNFYFYALVLLGLVIAISGFVCLSYAQRLVRADPTGWRRAVYLSTGLVALTIPMVTWGPSGMVTVLAIVNLIALAAFRLSDSKAF